MEVKWKDGFENFYKGADPNKVYGEIAAIGETATPEQIVEAAKDERSELHKCFTWDDTEAAIKWRKHEARQITHLLVIRDDNRDKEQLEFRVFQVTDSPSAGYRAAPLIFKVEDEYQKLLRQALRELRAFKEKYKSLQELDYILNLID